VKKTVFIKNAAILTVSGLALRFIGVIFKVWLASLIGSEGMGLYQLGFSVYVLASTFATSGISTAVTRLCANALASNDIRSAKKVLRYGILLSLFIALISFFALFVFSDFISENLLFDERCSLSLKIMAISLPFMGCCSCFRGYFLARRKATPPAISQIFEQIIRIAVIFVAVRAMLYKGLTACCGAVFLGDAAAEFLSCFFLYIVYLSDKYKANTTTYSTVNSKNLGGELIRIAFPITSGRYLNSLLRTVENVIVPKRLRLYNGGGKSALSQFGMIKGMALPLVFFPSTLLGSVSTLLIPELSEAKAKNQTFVVKGIVSRIISLTAICSYIFSAIFFLMGEEIGLLVYKSADVGTLIKLLSPIVPLMYLDSISDGILKGLDKQNFTFKLSVSDSLFRNILIFISLPKFGLKGFIFVMYLSNAYTGFFNLNAVTKTTLCDFDMTKTVIIPITSAYFCTLLSVTLLNLFCFPTVVLVGLAGIISVVFYFCLLKLFDVFSLKAVF